MRNAPWPARSLEAEAVSAGSHASDRSASDNTPSGVDELRWPEQIRAAWQKSVQAIIETGSLLIAAKAALPHGRFLFMVEQELPFSKRTSQMLMAIAANHQLANANHGALPASWRTLYELSRLDEQELDLALERGLIGPRTRRRDVHDAAVQARRLLGRDAYGDQVGPETERPAPVWSYYNEDQIGRKRRIDPTSVIRAVASGLHSMAASVEIEDPMVEAAAAVVPVEVLAECVADMQAALRILGRAHRRMRKKLSARTSG